MIHSVVLLSTWLIESAASGGDAISGSREQGMAAGRPGDAPEPGRRLEGELHGQVPPAGTRTGAGRGGGPRGGRGT